MKSLSTRRRHPLAALVVLVLALAFVGTIFAAFLFVLMRTYKAKRFTHDQEITAIVVSYYWHFVDVVWIGLFFVIYIMK